MCCGEPPVLRLPEDVSIGDYVKAVFGDGVIVYVGTDPTGSSGVCHC